MGDGRYYTITQFMNMTCLLPLIFISVICCIYSYYRNQKNSINIHITALFFQLGLISLLRFVEEVLPNIYYAEKLRSAQNFFFVVIILQIALLLLNSTKIKSNNKIHKNSFAIIIGTVLLPLIALLIGVSFIENYRFHQVSYAIEYSYILLVLLLFGIAIMVYTFMRTRNRKKKEVLLIVAFFYLSPIFSYYLANILRINNIDFVEFGLTFSMILVINIMNLNASNQNVVPIIFDKIVERIEHKIVIFNKDGELIYENKPKHNTIALNNKSKYQSNQIDDLFMGEVTEVVDTSLHKKIKIKNKEGKDHYYQVIEKKISRKGKRMGMILTAIDITDLEEMIYLLDIKKSELELINKNLIDYSDVVYYLEKEKSINNLLEEITQGQTLATQNILESFESIDESESNDTLLNSVEETMRLCNKELSRVRHAVTTYQKIYGEKI